MTRNGEKKVDTASFEVGELDTGPAPRAPQSEDKRRPRETHAPWAEMGQAYDWMDSHTLFDTTWY
jgi:hypothetical protein